MTIGSRRAGMWSIALLAAAMVIAPLSMRAETGARPSGGQNAAGQSGQPASQGQQGQQSPQGAQPPTFRARVDSVSVDVIVTDKQGRPVTDLTPEDFEVKEGGKPQTVDSMKLIKIDDGIDDPQAQRDILSLDDQRREAAREDNRLFVVFLDDYHVRLGNSMRIREKLAQWAVTLSPHDLVAVTTPLMPLDGLTLSRNHDELAHMMMAFVGRKYDYTPRNAMEERYVGQPPETLERMRNDIVIRQLSGLCLYLGSMREGKKTILYVSEGMSNTIPVGAATTGTGYGNKLPGGIPYQPSQREQSQQFFDSTQLLGDMQRVFESASHANTMIYTLDPRGLAPSEFSVEDSVGQQQDRQILNETSDLLRVIAGETDGRAIVNKNEPFNELRQMVRDNSAYYLLGYTSTLAPRDGKFHEIQVRVKRKDVDVRARKGYWAYSAEEADKASAAPKAGPAADVQGALDALAAVAEPGRGRKVSTWLGARRGPGEKALVTFAWEAAPPAGPVDPMDAVNQLVITARAPSGDELFSGPVPRDSSVQRPAGSVTFEAPPGAVQVRIVSQNAKGLRLDTDETQVQVPDFTNTGPQITTPFIFRGRTARDIQQIRAAASPVPTAQRAFSRTERLLLRFQAYGPAGTTPKLSMRLLNRNGDSIAQIPEPTKTDQNSFECDLSLAAFPPGDYLVEIDADSNGEIVRQLVGIRVSG